jgi:hypothetical protein
MACFPLTRVPRYVMPDTSFHPASAALPSAHPARGVDDELRWGPISMRVCTTCFAPSGPREVWDAALFFCGDRSYSRALCPRRARCGLHRTRSGPRELQLLRTPIPPARGLGSQALRQRALVASSVLDAPSRHGCRRHPSSEGRVGELHMRTPRRSARRRLSSVTAEPRVPPPNPQVAERAKA